MSQEKPIKTLRKELITEAQRLSKTNDGQPLSRDYFRSNSSFKDRWSSCFGTFSEFMIASKLPTISHPPNPELPIEAQVELEREKIHAKSDQWRSKFTFLSKRYDKLAHELDTVIELSKKTPQLIDIKPKLSSGKSESAAVMIASDWHAEEEVSFGDVEGINLFNLKECEIRAEKFFQGGQRLWTITNRDTRVATIVLGLLGDFINNMIHDDARDSNNLLPADAIWFVQNLLHSGIKFLLETTDVKELIIVCHSGNHGRLTQKQRNGRNEAGNSLERYMYHNLQLLFADEPRIRFQIAEGYHSYVNLFGTYPIRFHHGHGIRYQGGVGGITIPVRKAIAQWNKEEGHRETRLDVFGHYHQYMDGGDFICNGSLVGYNAFAKSIKAEYQRPMQAFFLVNKNHNAKSISAPIFLTDGN